MLVMPDSTREAMIGSWGGSPRALACADIQAAICSFGASSPGYFSEPASAAAGAAGAPPGGAATGAAGAPAPAGGTVPVPPMRMNLTLAWLVARGTLIT